MGARLYNPSTGRFNSVDAVQDGNRTAYGYPEDPVGSYDLTGTTTRPGDGGGCVAYMSNIYKTGTTIVGVFTVKCDELHNRIAVGGLIYRYSDNKLAHREDYCNICYKFNLTVKFYHDRSGSQTYGFVFESANWTGVGLGGWGDVAGGGSLTYLCYELGCGSVIWKRRF